MRNLMCRIKDIPINTLHLEDCASHDNVAMLQELESGMFCMSPCTHVYMWPARSKNLKRSSILFSLALQSLLLPAPQSTGSTCSCTLEQMQLWLLGFFSLVYPTGHPGTGLHRRSDCSRAAAGPVWASRRRAYMNTWTMIRVSPWQDPVPPEALFLFWAKHVK